MTGNFAQRLFFLNQCRPKAIALHDETRSLTFEQLENLTKAFGTQLKSHEFFPQSRVILYFDDCVELNVAFLALIAVGLNPVCVNHNHKFNDLTALVRLVDAQAIITDHDLALDMPITIINKSQILDQLSVSTFEFYQFHPDEPCFWYSTSGTTGRSKSVVHRHSNLTNHHGVARDIWHIDSASKILNASKLSFAYGIYTTFIMGLMQGATVHFISGIPSPSKIFDSVNRQKITHLFVVPSVVNALIKHAQKNNLEFDHSLEYVASSGESLPTDIAKRFNDTFQVQIRNSFGTTEFSAMQFTPRFEDYEIGTIGKPLPGYSVKLLDENQNPVPDGTVGELWIQGDSMASCYWKQTQWSHYSFVGQWFRTGDMIVKLPSGNYQYVSRRDDYIKIDGQWVAANEIESALLEISGIDDAAVVFEVSDKELPKIHAFVVTTDTSLDQQTLNHALTNVLPRFKIPKHYHFIDSIPKTLTNKKTKYVLSNSLNITELSQEII